MRIVVTGASGNIGTALLRRLGEEPERHEVVGICRRPPAPEPPYDGVDWIATDLSDEGAYGRLVPALRGVDAVVHLAWGFQPSRDTDYLHRLDVGGSTAVLRAAQKAGVEHLVHVSSLGAYSPGEDDERVHEAWPAGGIETLAYSRHKAAVESLLDQHEREQPGGMTVTRVRPALVMHRAAGSALLRYTAPALMPAALLRHLPLLPVDRTLRFQVVHATDLADALVRMLDRRPGGAFNVATEPVLDRDDVAAILGARPVHVDRRLLRAGVDAAWRARLQSLDPGWLDLAFSVPLMDAGRARSELDWRPQVDAHHALADALGGMADAAATASPALRPRTVLQQVRRLVRHGTTGSRRLP